MADNPIEAIRARLRGGESWIKEDMGHYGLQSTKVCLLGAAYSVATTTERETPQQDLPGVMLILQVIKEQYPADHRSLSIVAFNDCGRTAWEDVDRVLDKAARLWDEQHALQ